MSVFDGYAINLTKVNNSTLVNHDKNLVASTTVSNNVPSPASSVSAASAVSPCLFAYDKEQQRFQQLTLNSKYNKLNSFSFIFFAVLFGGVLCEVATYPA